MAANIYLVDLADIRQMIFDELKLDPSDSNEVLRINRDINAVYQDEVVPFKRWPWLSGHFDIQTVSFTTNSNGTASLTPGLATATLTVAPLTSMVGYKFAVDQFEEVYEVTAHTPGSTTLTLNQPWNGALLSGVSYKLWLDNYALPTDMRETTEIWHDFMKEPMTSVGLQDFRRRVSESPRASGRPIIYCTIYDKLPETGSDRSRYLRVHPSVFENATTLHGDYIKHATPLQSDGDEPLVPIEDRIVLVYGALARAWRRARNPEEAANNYTLFQQKLGRMAGKLEDSTDRPALSPDSEYLSRKRQKPNRGTMSGPFNSGGSYTAPTYLKNPVIEGAKLTANVAANPGVTVDGRDISVDGGNLDSHLSNLAGRHLASQITVTPTGIVTATDAQTAVSQLASGVSSAATSAALTAHTGASSGVHGVTGSVVGTTDTQTLTNKTLTSPVINSPTGIVKADVGLGNVDNTSDATKNSAVATLTNKTLTAPVINSPTGLVKADVGLGNVDNTSDATKNSAAATLTNKTIAAGSNTITGLTNSNLSGSAAITNANLAAMAANTVKANATGSSATPTDVALSASATASAVAVRDANANVQYNNVNESFTTTATAAGTTTLTAASSGIQQFTGTTTQNVVLPATNASGMSTGFQFQIFNRSTGVVTVKDSSGSTVQAMAGGSQLVVTAATSGSPGTWDVTYTITGVLPTSLGGTGVNSTATFPSSGVIDTTTSTATLTNKTLTSPVLNTPTIDVMSLTEQGSTPATPSSGSLKLYGKTDNKLYYLNPSGTEQQVGAGAGSGFVNYITNPDAETDTSGYAVYSDTPGAAPVNGAGAGTITATWTRSTSSPLRGTASFLLTKAASNSQGQGVAYDFTIASGDQAQVLAITGEYTVGSGTYADGDVLLYVYDKTNSTVIYPSAQKIMSVTAGLPAKFQATFQAASNSTSYRLCVHIATTSASAYTLKFDSMSVGPQVKSYGPYISDWQSYTPTFSNLGTVTNTSVWWRRIGDSIQISGFFTTGTVAASIASMSMPSGVSLGTSKIASGTSVAGRANQVATNSNDLVIVDSANPTNLYFSNFANGTNFTAQTGSAAFASAANTEVWAEFPVAGWSSGQLLSSDADTRVVSAILRGSSTSLSASYADVVWTNVDQDTHGAFSSATYTVPVSGTFDIAIAALLNGTFALNTLSEVQVLKNGSQAAYDVIYSAGAVTSQPIKLNASLKCNAGDTLKIQVRSGATSPSFNPSSFINTLSINKRQGPSQIAASESINMRYTNSAGTSIPNAATTKVPFATKSFDSHSGWNGTDTYTAQAPGLYLINLTVGFTTNATGDRQIWVGKNGSGTSTATGDIPGSTVNSINIVSVSDTIRLVAGDTLAAYAFQNSGGALALSTVGGANVFSITRVGI